MKKPHRTAYKLFPLAVIALAALALLSAGGGIRASQENSAATLILTGGRIWTGDAKLPWAEAVAIRDNRIIAAGGAEDVAKLRTDTTKVVELGGRFAMPGINDAHIHFLNGAMRLSQLDLNDADSLEEIQRRLARYAQQHPQDTWLLGYGWQYSVMPGGPLPTRADLDAVVADRPVFLSAYDGHTAWVNSKALEVAGVTAESKFKGFGEIVRDAAGQPTGVLKESAQGLVRSKIPAPSRAQRLDAARQAVQMAARLGITSIQNASGDESDLDIYEELLRRGELTLRVSVAISIRSGATEKRIDEVRALARKYSGPMLRVGGIKLLVDGVIESHTAAMLEPYSDGANTSGEPALTQDELSRIVALADRAGLQVYIHAIGDRGVRMALNAYEHARRVNGPRDARHRIEHIEAVSPADISRFAQLGVLASMEPIHADPGTVDVWSRAVGPERVKYAFAWRSLEQAGARLVFSSDWPAAITVSPIRGLHNAVNRQTRDGRPPGGWIPEQRVSLESTLAAYTQAGAYSSFEEKEKGTIAAGKIADVIVLSDDPFRIPAARLHTLQVETTVFDGRVIYGGK